MLDDLNGLTHEQTYQQEQQPNAPEQELQKTDATQKEIQEKEYNFKKMREDRDAAERRAAELERLLQQQIQQQQPSRAAEDDEDFNVSDDSYVEARYVKKYAKNIKKELQETKKQLEEMRQMSSVSTAEIRLKNEFNDFERVVTKDNLEKLASQKPALYRSIMSNQDIYDRGYAAYEMIRSSLDLDTHETINKRLEENKSKPRSAANAAPQTGDTPLSRVGDYDRRVLSEERKEELRRQVARAKQLR